MTLRANAERFIINTNLAPIEGAQLVLAVLQLLLIHQRTKKALSLETRLHHNQKHALCSRHMLDNCDEFVMKNHDERLAFIQSKGLCFGCLNKGHISKDCHKRLTCKTCGTLHPTSLHFNTKDDKELKGPEGTGAMESRVGTETNPDQAICNCSSVCHSVERISVTNSLIVPVWLHHKDSPQREVMVYTLLDDARDTTFYQSQNSP